MLENNQGLLERDYKTNKPFFDKFDIKAGHDLNDPDTQVCYVLKSQINKRYLRQMVAGKLDTDLGRVLKHLLKQNTSTKLRALSELVELITGDNARSPEELAALVPQWTQVYRRLHLDNAAPVRVAAAKALGEVASGAGRGLGLSGAAGAASAGGDGAASDVGDNDVGGARGAVGSGTSSASGLGGSC